MSALIRGLFSNISQAGSRFAASVTAAQKNGVAKAARQLHLASDKSIVWRVLCIASITRLARFATTQDGMRLKAPREKWQEGSDSVSK